MKQRLKKLLIVEDPRGELRRFRGNALLRRLARNHRLRTYCLQRAIRSEGGMFYTQTGREIIFDLCGVGIGAFSYGSCFSLGALAPGTKVGRYVSVGANVRSFAANHPLSTVSTHPFFFNEAYGLVDKTNVPFTRLEIGHDAWIGEGVIITPGCQRIGLGAVVGAGSVVTKDVRDFQIVAGNPARPIRPRFGEEVQELILKSRWWEKSLSELRATVNLCSKPTTVAEFEEMLEPLFEMLDVESCVPSGLS